ncbi:hypothetical protein CDD80_4944 [Ophiocordyceps camponoti-rufipedis]|uniref:Allergen Asp f 4 n=1 Tax=Ophiocordyceps camponoti-rufipedis TaxID=2004952 RepID=A0A2C5ZBX8_9HYPO|nr:hypothetical protein CDD80_4944 [Ophiocordyceps camponoti-rufipedis]
MVNIKTSVSTLLVAAALGVVAHPSAHGHGHRHFHRAVAKNADINQNTYGTQYTKSVHRVNDVADKSHKAPPPSPKEDSVAASPPAVPAQVKNVLSDTLPAQTAQQSQPAGQAQQGGSTGTGASSYEDFCTGSKSKRATNLQVATAGNLGGPGDMYGCNLKLIQSNIADKYNNTVRFDNAGDNTQACVCWLKIGPDRVSVNGFFKDNKVLSFNIPPKGQQYLAVQEDSKGGCSCYKDQVPLTVNGQFAGTWLEFDMASRANGGCSGADASSLVAHSSNMDVPGLKVCEDKNLKDDSCSIIYAGGKGNKLSYPGGTENADGLSVNLQPGPARFIATVDYAGPAPANAVNPTR